MTKIKNDSDMVPVKKRKTVDEILGMHKWNINVLLIIATVGSVLFKGGLVLAVASFCGLDAIYYLIKRRKELTKKQKYLGWGLVILWLIVVGVVNQPAQ
jgi:hypothetical protein